MKSNRIEDIVERSSLGERQAKRYRSRVSDEAANFVLGLVSARSAMSGRRQGGSSSGRIYTSARDGSTRSSSNKR